MVSSHIKGRDYFRIHRSSRPSAFWFVIVDTSNGLEDTGIPSSRCFAKYLCRSKRRWRMSSKLYGACRKLRAIGTDLNLNERDRKSVV